MRGIFILSTLFVMFALLFFLPVSAFSSEVDLEIVQLDPIESDVAVLTVINASGEKMYTLDEIEALGLKRLRTSTFWPEDDGAYEGVLVRDLLAHAGMVNCSNVVITALDEYRVKIPCDDFQNWPVLLATRRDGKPMSIRKKGPTRIIYPKDIGGEIARSDMRSRWIWEIGSISLDN